MNQQPTNQIWHIESTGINLVAENEQTGRPIELFWIWCAANIGILGIVYGAIISSFGLSFLQGVLATLLGVASFILVGYTSLAGKIGRTATLTLSRVIFGIKGNIAPTALNWLNLMGWEAVNLITGTLTLSAMFSAAGLPSGYGLTSFCLILFAGFAILFSLLGQATLIVLQSWITKIFGTMTLIVVGYIVTVADWETILSLPSGDWLTAFLPAVSVVAAGTGVGWALAGADYSRYQRKESSSASILAAVVGGAGLPLILLICTGLLISVQLPELIHSDNPIVLIGSILPPWMAIPYLATATAGVITIAVLSLYSASLNLLTIGINIKQAIAVSCNALLVLGVAIYFLFISSQFLDAFISFILFFGVFLAAWDAIFLLDYLFIRRYQGYNPALLFDLQGSNQGVNIVTLSCWLLGAGAGLLVTHGPLAIGIFANSSLGIFLAFLVALFNYSIVLIVNRK